MVSNVYSRELREIRSEYKRKVVYHLFKRLFDLFFGLIMLVLLFPVFLCLIIVIKLTSIGPAIFKQIRIGKDNKEFLIYKFRTMTVDAPNVAAKEIDNHEQHLTKIGKILRKTSLDEIPQLINIIKGDMSFIGYRPLIPNEIDTHEYRNTFRVYKIKPGITGWAQINGRNQVTDYDKAKLDFVYLKKRSVLFDIKILFITFVKVIKKEGIHVGNYAKKVMPKDDEKNAA